MPKPAIRAVASHEPSILETARTAFLTEIAGLQALAGSLTGSVGKGFQDAIEMILALSGRVIVTGVGKSAHVARKIAATFASTGQPAYFVHSGEAGHGDLGMIAPEDLVIALSYSGETQELSSIIAYARRFNIPLVAITGRETGTLAKVATIVLPLPDVPEACPMRLAPTTSTTMMMALGDALAITLLSQRGFSSSDFRVLHPGGNLGSSLARVGDRMHQGERLPLVEESVPMGDVLLEMSAKGFGCVGIVNDHGFLVGVITDGDLRRHMNPGLLTQKAKDIMTQKPATILPDTLMGQALAFLNQRSITSLFVVESLAYPAKPCGIIHIHDFLRMGISFNPGKGTEMTVQAPRKPDFTPRKMLHDIQALKGRSRMIGRLKYGLPVIALVALALLIAWPQAQKWAHRQELPLAQQAPFVEQTANNVAIHPEYKSSNDKNQPYTITADRGMEISPEKIDLVRPRMVMALKAGEVVTLTSNSGALNKVTNKMHLVGNVTLTHSQGYVLKTAQAWIDCNQGSAFSNSPIWGNGPAGAIEAKGFRLAERGTRVSFIGGSQLLIASGGEKK